MVTLSWVLGIVSVLGVAGTVAAMVFVPTVAIPVLTRIVTALLGCKICLVVMLLVGTALGSYWYGRHGQYERGHAAAIAEIAGEDKAALDHATEKREVYIKCKTHSGSWNQSTGECE
jgi:apolipoprotein N-acyltransferase